MAVADRNQHKFWIFVHCKKVDTYSFKINHDRLCPPGRIIQGIVFRAMRILKNYIFFNKNDPKGKEKCGNLIPKHIQVRNTYYLLSYSKRFL